MENNVEPDVKVLVTEIYPDGKIKVLEIEENFCISFLHEGGVKCIGSFSCPLDKAVIVAKSMVIRAAAILENECETETFIDRSTLLENPLKED